MPSLAITAHDFACHMNSHWTSTLGNVSSPKLLSLWTAMGQAFLGAIEASKDPLAHDRHLWRILRPETGTGKTQGIRIFSAMVARENLKLPVKERTGVLIVTRLTAEADKLAEEINATFAEMVAGEKRPPGPLNIVDVHGVIYPVVAVAKHSQPTGRVKKEVVDKTPILILTHASYVAALDRLEQANEDRWSSMINWEGGVRHLTVIDETITSLLETYSINIESLKKVIAYIPEKLRSSHSHQIGTLETLLQTLRRMRELREQTTEAKALSGDVATPAAADAVVWDQAARMGFSRHGFGDDVFHLYGNMAGLRAEMLKLDEMVSRSRGHGRMETTPVAKLADETLQAVENFVNRWMVYHHHYVHGDTLNQTRLIFPADIPAPVVLDATAEESVLWHLLGHERVRIVDIPRGSRSYANMTLHIAKADRLGLSTMRRLDVAQDRITQLVSSLPPIDGKTLLVLHQDAESLAQAMRKPWLSTAHYGRIDGRNDWNDHTCVVILGLDYRDRTWVNGLFAALEDYKGSGPRIGEVIQQTDETYKEMDRRQLAVSIIQALNRIRCRKVVDAEGNCAPCKAYLFLPDNDTGRAIRQAIGKEMPGLVIRDWDFQLDPPSRSIRKGSGHARLLEFMRAALAGETNLRDWADGVGLSGKALKHLRHTLNDPEHDLTKSLAEIGVSYSVIGAGRGAKSLLIKRPI